MWVEPWTTTLSAGLIWLVFGAAVTVLAERDRASDRMAVMIGVLLALIPLARPADAVVIAVVVVALAVMFLRDGSGRRFLAVVAVTGALVVAAYGALYVAIYGFALSDYMALSAVYGLNLGWLGWKAYVILVEPTPWFPGGRALLRACPWLVVGAAGLIVAAGGRGTRGLAARMMLCASLAYLAAMLAYVDLLPSGLWRYGNVHYFKWLLPLFGLFAWIGVREARARPVPFLATLALLVLGSGIRITLTPVDGGAPARAIAYAAPPGDFAALYMAKSAIDDGGGRLRNVIDYRQVPATGGTILAVALKREFRGRAVWHAVAPTDTAWPVTAPGSLSPVRLADTEPQDAVARFGHRVSFGWPCWLPPYVCTTEGWQASAAR